MAQLAVSVAIGEDIQNIKFENKRCIYLPYKKVTKENVKQFE